MNVISELVKPQPDGNVLRWIGETDEALLFLSVLTLGEIRSGIERLNPGNRRGRLESRLAVDLRLRLALCRQVPPRGAAGAGY